MKPIHILNQLGVLATFSVAKKITEEDIQKYFSKQKKSGKSEAEMQEMLQEKIFKDIHEALSQNKIPGLIGSQEMAKQWGLDQSVVDKVPELNRLVMLLSHKLTEKKYDKMSLCYFINSLVNILGLTERDFQKFHEHNREDDEEDRFDDDED